jgi:hypothetical protein
MTKIMRNCVVCSVLSEDPCQTSTDALPIADPAQCESLKRQPLAPDGRGYVVRDLVCASELDECAIVVERVVRASDVHLLSMLHTVRQEADAVRCI